MAPVHIPLRDKSLKAAVSGLKAVSHAARLQILCGLVGRELSVSDLVDLTGQSQSSVSQHLARMKSAGILADRRNGNVVFYSVKEAGYEGLITALCAIYGGRKKGGSK